MTQSPTRTVARNRVREFLADRENLTDSARQRFFEILEHYGVFRAGGAHRTWRYLLLGAVIISPACGFIDGAHHHWSKAAGWLACFLLSLIPILRIKRHEQRVVDVDDESIWRAYCLFLRPIVLARFPGLLDRNLSSLPRSPNRFVPHPRLLLRDILAVRGLDYWWAALGGIWCSMGVLLVLRATMDHPISLLAAFIPLAGFVGGPVVWAFGQALIYFLAQKGADDVGG